MADTSVRTSDPAPPVFSPAPPAATPTPELVHTIGQTAKKLHVSPMTVRRLLARGELQRVRLGRAVRVLASSIEAFAAKGGAR